VPKLRSLGAIIAICRQNKVVTHHTDDPENSEVDRPDDLNAGSDGSSERTLVHETVV